MPPISTMANTRILILGAIFLIVCMDFFWSKSGPFFGLDALVKVTKEEVLAFGTLLCACVQAPVLDKDECFVPTLVGDNTTAVLPEGLHCVLERAATEDSTVIVTIMNKAWAVRGSLLDLFMDSFRKGEGTYHLLKHLVIVSVDEKGHQLCKEVHPHCYFWKIEGKDFSEEKRFMTPDYLDLMWDRLQFLRTILDLGYNFAFTDTDVMWLRNPFPLFHNISTTSAADMMIACDHYGIPTGGSSVNGGFFHVKSNNKTTLFFRYWHSSRDRYSKEGEHEQHAFNMIKHDRFVRGLGINFYFLDTKAFSGFCEHGQDLGQVYTMHANCCGSGLENKLHDLRLVMEDWSNYTSNKASNITWRIPKHC